MKKQLLLLVMMLLPMMAMADAVEIDGIYYNLITKGNIAEVTSNPNKYTGSIAIPDKISYEGIEYDVRTIEAGAFSGCSSLSSITIPSSVTGIGKSAFAECGGITSVFISDLEAWCRILFGDKYSNPLINAHHLYLNGDELKELIIPNTIEYIGDYAFWGCEGLTSIIIPNNVTSIGKNTFRDCKALTDLTIGNSVTIINYGAFYGCRNLTSVIIPNSVKIIDDFAFRNCFALTTVTIPNGVSSIGKHAFFDCI